MTLDLEKLGPRICIMGPSCSGKSTLAETLGAELNLPVVHLDQLAFTPGTNWVRRSDEALIREHDETIAQERWVIEGNYNVCLPQRLARATDVIYLDAPVWLCLWRYVRRSFFEKSRAGGLRDAEKDFNWFMVWYTAWVYPQKRPRYLKMLKAYPHLRVQISAKPPF